eukprot:CAMPEP_0197189578 /NCGR_PEP_ID=MMETSP1423-20130617/20008_1 /TAXON_ID=476441 /ORGANISM="Pseudo-nitzschia heimii, Strain UNC1101" /LENGTH=485 /DNA_ID=CAMNT_0042641727 /DNA_START=155 /DNA_END=1609 /DNA_ORIENTATION=+
MPLRWLCHFALVFVLIRGAPSTSFSAEKIVTLTSRKGCEKKRGGALFATSSSSLSSSPSCIGCLTIRRKKISEKKKSADRSNTIKYHVIGTSHFRCDSYKEVSALIRQKQPDGVVIELDPERLLRLTLDDAIIRSTATPSTPENVVDFTENRWFGGDFLSAIETSKELDVPIFLADEYPIETRQRFMNTLLDVDSYNPEKFLMTIKSLVQPRLIRTIDTSSEIISVDVFGTFLEDPRKLIPLVATSSLPILAVIFTILNGTTVSSNYEMLATLVALVTSFVASCKVYNNLIADRDAILASNVQRAAKTMALLKSNQLIRKRWTFSVNDDECDETQEEVERGSGQSLSMGIPLFTLKNPLKKDAVRNLNLFEPRWLKMIDRLLLQKVQEQDLEGFFFDNTVPDSTCPNTERRIIGCVTCTNKFYSAINIAKPSNSNDPSLFQEGRYADVIFCRRGRLGELTSVTEGSRPSGARKVGAKILGKGAFE